MFQVIVFVPETHKDQVKAAMFSAGAGKWGNYDSCCFEHHGVGQFRPLNQSRPFIGTQGEIEFVQEVRIEMICEEVLFPKVEEAIKSSHPYETPAYYAIKTVG
jgi:hypothetical protein